MEKAEHAKQDILKNYPEAKVDVIPLDNMDLSTVKSFAETFDSKYPRLDYLLNNAGIMAQPKILSKDGHDIQFQTNHLAHFYLTKLLWKKLVDTEGQSRVVQHSSSAHHMLGPMFDKTQMDNPPYSWGILGINVLLVHVAMPMFGFSPMDNWRRYGMSKLCNVLFMNQLKSKLEEKGLKDKVISVACHPGWANTNLQNQAEMSFRNWQQSNAKYAQSAADGSLPLLMAAVGAGVKNGDYFGPSGKNEMVGPPTKCPVKGHGNDVKMAEEHWDYSCECITDKFDI
jgi:NAD(P)-dependent dehydrogenase (short-subunit alcohol dehydrogenase family)